MRTTFDRAGSGLSVAGLFLAALACGSDKSVTLPETPIAVAFVNGRVVNEFFIEQPGATITAVVRNDDGVTIGAGMTTTTDADGRFTRMLEVQQAAPFEAVATLTAAYDALHGTVDVRLRFGRLEDAMMPPDTATVLIMIE